MIEDALKTTRAVERALLAVSLVALVFVLSIDAASQQRRLLEDLQRLQDLSGPAYAEFVDQLVENRVGAELEARESAVAEALERGADEMGLRLLGTSQIAEVFGRPAHLGRLRPEDLVVGDPEASLAAMDRLFKARPLDRDVQVVLAHPRGVAPFILEFAEASAPPSLLGPQVGRVQNVRLYPILDVSETAETFLPSDDEPIPLRLSFEYHSEAGPPVPIYEREVDGDLLVLPGSSWLRWVTEEGRGGRLLGQSGGRSRWIPEVVDEDRRNMTLAELRGLLEEEVKKARAEYQSISLPGVSVPGSLALTAIPLAFLGLLLTLIAHVQHLRRLVPGKESTFREFLWTPLSPARRVAFAASILPTVVLPGSVLVLLAVKAGAFDGPRSLSVLWCALATMAIVISGLAAMSQLARLHAQVHLRRPPPR